jgi:transglutaminase-like putative cysteine protease
MMMSIFNTDSCGTYPARNGSIILNKFITPDDGAVKNTAEYIVNTLIRDSIEDRIVGAFNWIALNVIYTSDRKQFGRNDWWQYPSETLGCVLTGGNSFMYGDCEDSSFLFVSLLLALGVPSQCARVGISETHAWVECRLGNVWYLFETTDDIEMLSLITADGVVGKSGSYDVKVYVYEGSCQYV